MVKRRQSGGSGCSGRVEEEDVVVGRRRRWRWPRRHVGVWVAGNGEIGVHEDEGVVEVVISGGAMGVVVVGCHNCEASSVIQNLFYGLKGGVH